jgi:YHS domain-containing protein
MKKNIFTFLLVFAIGASLFAVAKTDAQIRFANADEIGQQVHCPIMDVNFKATKKTKVGVFNGGKIFLCCNTCAKLFKKNPEKYIQ